MLNMVAQVSWNQAGDPTHYAVVAPDMFGLAGNWTSFDGEILGLGCGGNASFTNRLASLGTSRIALGDEFGCALDASGFIAC